MTNQKKHNIDISFLYQLSLSIKYSQSLQDNCKTFLDCFIDLETVDIAAISIQNTIDKSSYDLIYATSAYEMSSTTYWDRLPQEAHFVIDNKNVLFAEVKHQSTIESGIYVFTRLGEIGFLMFYINNELPFSESNWADLTPIINRFQETLTGHLEGQLLHKKNAVLKHQIELYDAAIHHSSEGMILNDENNNIQFMNRAFCQMVGYSREELIGKNCYEFLFTEEDWIIDGQPLESIDKKTFKGCTEQKLIRKDGASWWGLVALSPLLSKNGDFHGVFVTVSDISDKKKAELEREELIKAVTYTKDKYQSVVQSLSEGVIMTDTVDKITYVNQQMCTLTGYLEQEMLGKKAYELLLQKEEWNESEDKLEDRSDGVSESYVKRHIKKDGTFWWGNINASPLTNESGEFIGTLAAVMDVTKQKNAEAQREQLLKELAEKNKDLDEFAYIVSHDLKAPLRAIKTLSNWIYEDYADVLDEEGKHQIELLQKRVLRMHNFIESMLEYTRIGSTKIPIESFDLNESVLQIIDSFQPLDNCEIKILSPLPNIKGEKIRIEQVFQNLISNSIKYNDKPQGLIEISHTCTDNFNIFKVRDNGIGIEKKYFDKIFQIFQTLQTRDSYESTGVGLTIVKKIVEAHQGKVTLESEYGLGTTFIFTLKK